MLAYILRYILGATCLACHSLRPFVRNMIYGGLYITAFQTATSFFPIFAGCRYYCCHYRNRSRVQTGLVEQSPVLCDIHMKSILQSRSIDNAVIGVGVILNARSHAVCCWLRIGIAASRFCIADI